MPHAYQCDLTARDGETYRLLVSMPPEPAPATGFPVIVLLDGHALFAMAAIAARLQAARPEVTGIGPAVLVGIGYPGDVPFDALRRQRDFLPGPGGADRFLDTILTEILPAADRIAPLDGSRRALVGHSYGGLFTLHALFTRPGAFEAYVASSPSVWWQERAILREEEAFRAAGPAPSTRLLITVGGAEQDRDRPAASERAERRWKARMVDNASEMATRLAVSSRTACELLVLPGENHVSVLPAMISRAVSFALAGTTRPTMETA